MTALIIVLASLLLLFLLLLFLLAPARHRPQRDVFAGMRVAHRGLHGGVPENSPAAFRAARAAGLGVELDVRLTADDEVVVFHDDTLTRMCGVDKRPDELTLAELRELSLAGTEERIPLFSEVLEELGGVPLVCEVKKARSRAARVLLCEKTAALLDRYPGDCCMESFDPLAVRWFRLHRPALVRGQLSHNFIKKRGGVSLAAGFVVTQLLTNCLSRPDFIAYCYTDDSLGFALCRRLFHPLCVAWTARGPEAEAAVPGFYDTVIFEKEPRAK